MRRSFVGHGLILCLSSGKYEKQPRLRIVDRVNLLKAEDPCIRNYSHSLLSFALAVALPSLRAVRASHMWMLMALCHSFSSIRRPSKCAGGSVKAYTALR